MNEVIFVGIWLSFICLIGYMGMASKKAFMKTACKCLHSPGSHYHKTQYCYRCKCQSYEQLESK